MTMYDYVERDCMIYPTDPEDPRRRSSVPLTTMQIVDKLNELTKFEARAKQAAHALMHPVNTGSITDTLWMPDGPETIFDALGGDIDEAEKAVEEAEHVRPMGVRMHELVEQSLQADVRMNVLRRRLRSAGFIEVMPGDFVQQDPNEEDRHG